jgi:type I restriction enzyme, S subunit
MIKKRLGDILNFKRGYDLPSYLRRNGNYPVISSSGISGYHSEFKAGGEGVVTGRYGTLGEVYYVNGRYWPHNTALYVTDFKGNYPKYVYFLLKYLGNLKTGDKSTVPGVNRNDLHEVIVPYIDVEYQRTIADCLFQIEEKIALNNKIDRVLESITIDFYNYWFVQFDFPNDQGRPYKSSGGKMAYNTTLKRAIPQGWIDLELSDIIDKIGTGLNPRDNFKLGNGNNFYVTIKNIDNGKVIFDDKCDRVDDEALRIINKRSDLQPGDILFTSIEPVGVTYFIHETPTNWNINESVFTLRPNYGKITSEYLYMLLSSTEMKTFTKNVSAGSIHKGIRHSALKTFRLPYGNLKLSEEFSKIIRPTLKQRHSLDNENRQLVELRDWLLPMLMNGQVMVNAKVAAI